MVEIIELQEIPREKQQQQQQVEIDDDDEKEERERKEEEDHHHHHHLHHHLAPSVITNATLDQELERAIQTAAQGRDIHYIQVKGIRVEICIQEEHFCLSI